MLDVPGDEVDAVCFGWWFSRRAGGGGSSGSILGIVGRLGVAGDGCGGCQALLRRPVIMMVS